MTSNRQEFFPIDDIIQEFYNYQNHQELFDIITIVGEGEPTLYKNLGQLINRLKNLTNKPIAVITNGSLLSDINVQNELMHADIVLPSMDAYNEISFRKINRPHVSIK